VWVASTVCGVVVQMKAKYHKSVQGKHELELVVIKTMTVTKMAIIARVAGNLKSHS